MKFVFIAFIVYTIYIIPVFSDCGCNKLKRDPTKPSEENACANQISMAGEKYTNEKIPDGMSLIPGGRYMIGCEKAVFSSDKEAPQKSVKIKDFYLDKHEVSNRKFKIFTELSSYITEAEKYNDSFVFQTHLSDEMKASNQEFRVVGAVWWYKLSGANWKSPFGLGSNLNDLWDHPVVHVSYNDAVQYCKWLGKRLPTEAEWETACRGGRKNKLFPWGNKLMPGEKHFMNIWQGDFPNKDNAEDGFAGTNPVENFKQNAYELHNIVGNVWEWTADLWTHNDKTENPDRVKKGGSYLCHKEFCYRYRCAARSQNTENSSAGNLGFRCAKNL